MTRRCRAVSKRGRVDTAVRPPLPGKLEFPLESRDWSPLSTRRVEARLRGTLGPPLLFSPRDERLSPADGPGPPAQLLRPPSQPYGNAGRRSGSQFNTLFPKYYMRCRRLPGSAKNQRLLLAESSDSSRRRGVPPHRGYCFPSRSTRIRPGFNEHASLAASSPIRPAR